jgi:chromosome segregation ATPase
MNERTLAKKLAALALEVDSLEKALAQANAELAGQTARRAHFERQTEELREQLAHARQRAKAAEREVGKLSAIAAARAHAAEVREHELQTRLQEALEANELRRQEVEYKERQRQTLEENLREVMSNLRNAAREAGGPSSAVAAAPPTQAHVAPLPAEPRNGGG